MSTLTPENSEAPRESLIGRLDALRDRTEEQMMLDDALATGDGFMFDGKRVDPADIYQSTKTSSPELASLAASYVDTLPKDVPTHPAQLALFCEDVRSLAASVLAQAEGIPRK